MTDSGAGPGAGASLDGFDLAGYLSAERDRVERALETAVERAAVRVRPELVAPIRHGVMSGGKRLRPILCIAGHEACGGDDRDGAAALGASVELIHAYSLMHDDLPCMDDADLRRGEPTTHRVFGEKVTMEAGAALIPLALAQALDAAEAMDCDTAAVSRILGCLAEAAGAAGMVGGQYLDLMGEGRALSEVELTDLHRRKTGALITAPLVMGGLAAGTSDERIEPLRRYGAAIGLAFQVADDILDATSNAEVLGKNPSDQELEKSTYVALYGLDGARERARALVDEAMGALASGGVRSPPLEGIARYIVGRRS